MSIDGAGFQPGTATRVRVAGSPQPLPLPVQARHASTADAIVIKLSRRLPSRPDLFRSGHDISGNVGYRSPRLRDESGRHVVLAWCAETAPREVAGELDPLTAG